MNHMVQRTVQFTPLVLEHTLLQYPLLWGEYNICALCCSYSPVIDNHYNLAFSFHKCGYMCSIIEWYGVRDMRVCVSANV